MESEYSERMVKLNRKKEGNQTRVKRADQVEKNMFL
jgi:hypothetical protein